VAGKILRKRTQHWLKVFYNVLTYHWQWRSSWTWTLEKGHSHCLTGKGKTLYVDCGQNLPEELALIQGSSWDPRDFVPMMYHCLHRNCKK